MGLDQQGEDMFNFFGRTNPLIQQEDKETSRKHNETIKLPTCNDVIKALNILETPAQPIWQCS